MILRGVCTNTLRIRCQRMPFPYSAENDMLFDIHNPAIPIAAYIPRRTECVI